MAMTTCPDCSTEHSPKAAACPQCGRPRRDRVSTVAKVAAVVLGVLIGLLILANL